MADRQDIDALLVGALYGELSAAEDAQLQAHLTSHPQERAALDAMERTRTRVREVVAEAGPLEPPSGMSGISALLLQEAARRAPSRKAAPVASGGAWAWLAGVMRPIMAHPAMTAAAAFVLVAGVAGTLYTAGHVAMREPLARSAARAEAPSPSSSGSEDRYQAQLDEQRLVPGAMPGASGPAGETANHEGRADGADLALRAETDRDSAATADDKRQAAPSAQAQPKGDLTASAFTRSVAGAGKADDKAEAKRKVAKDAFIQVTTPEPELKQFDEERAQPTPVREQAPSRQESARGAAAAPMAPQAATVTSAAPPPSAKPSGAQGKAPTMESVSADSIGSDGPRDAKLEARPEAKLEEWASLQHKKLTALVRASRCTEAATVAGELAARASEYYAAHVADDRALRACKPALDRARKREAERRGKPRPAAPADNAAVESRQ